jgi:hypothetical protein
MYLQISKYVKHLIQMSLPGLSKILRQHQHLHKDINPPQFNCPLQDYNQILVVVSLPRSQHW